MMSLRDYLQAVYNFDFSKPVADQYFPYNRFQRGEVFPAHQLVWLNFHRPRKVTQADREAADYHYSTGGSDDILNNLSFSKSYRAVMELIAKSPDDYRVRECERDWAEQKQVCLHEAGIKRMNYLNFEESIAELKKHHIAGNVVFDSMVEFIRSKDPSNVDGHAHLPTLGEVADLELLVNQA